MPENRNSRLLPLGWILVMTAVHFGMSLFALELRTGFSHEPVFWGLSGLSVAVISMAPRSWRVGLAAGLTFSAAASYLLNGAPLPLAAGYALGNGAAALAAGTWLGGQLPNGRRIVRLWDVVALAGGALVAAAVGSVFGGAVQWAVAGSASLETVGYWFSANLAGVLVGSPVFLAIVSLRREPPPEFQMSPLLIVATATAASYVSVVWVSAVTGRNFLYLVIVPLMISAVWLGQRITAILMGGLALALGVMTNSGLGPFAATESAFDPLIAGQIFMGVVQITVLTVGVEASRRRDLIAELDGILEATVEAVLVVDETGTIRQANRGSEATLGSPQAELIGARLTEFIPEDVFDGGTRDLYSTIARRRNGDEFWAEVSRGRIREKSGRRRTAIVVRDVSERIETEESVRRLQDEFVSNMTHELRTPLTAIIGFSEWLMSDLDSPTAASDLEIIHDSASSMKVLIDAILDFKRVSASSAQPAEIDLRDVVERSVGLARPAALERTITLNLDLDACPPIVGDLDQIEHAVRNVVSNAIKYSYEGGEVSVALEAREDSVHLAVVDEGIGIPESDQARLFERFFRAGNVGELQGTGLGLALVRQVVERHRGTVALTSAVGRGTSVEIVLPLESEGKEGSAAERAHHAIWL
jgi:PAS domain S-box-containing protein